MGNHDVWAEETAAWKHSPEYASYIAQKKVINDLREMIMKLPLGNMTMNEFDFVRETYNCHDDERDHRAIMFYSDSRFQILNAIFAKCT